MSESGQTFVAKDGTTRFVPEPEIPRYADSPEWTPQSGKVHVAVPDKDGVNVLRTVSIEAYRMAKKTAQRDLRLVGDSRAELLSQAASEAQEVAKDKLAAESAGLAAGIAAVPFGASIAGGIMGDREGALEANTRLREQNPLATGVGTAAQFALTTALTGGLAGAATKAAGYWTPMMAKTPSAMRLFGFADDAGNLIAANLIGRGASQTVANVLGRGASSVLLSAPGSVVYEAAIRADTDPSYTAESFSHDVGMDIMLGAAFDFAAPALVGAGVRTAAALARGAKKISPVRLMAKAMRFKTLPDQQAFSRELAALPLVLVQKSGRSSAARQVMREQVEEAVEAGVRRATISQALHPAAIAATDIPTKGLDDLLDAALGSSKVDPADVVLAQERKNSLVGLHGGVGGLENTVVSGLSSKGLGHVAAPTVTGKLPSASNLRVDFALAASELAEALGGTAPQLKPELDALIGLSKGTGAREAANMMMRLRNGVAISAAQGKVNPAVRELVKEHVDRALLKANPALSDLLEASDDFIDAATKSEGLISNVKNLDAIVDTQGLGAVGMNVDEMADAYQRLINANAVGAGDARFINGHLNSARAQLTKLAPQLEGAAAMNRVRNAIATEGVDVLVSPGVAKSAEHLTAAKVEANVGFAARLAETMEKFVAAPASKIGARGGIYTFREMGSYQEKEDAYRNAVAAIQAATGTPEDLQRTVATLSKQVVQDPEFASAFQQRTVQRFLFLKDMVPMPPAGFVPKTDSVYASPAEVSNFLEILGAADDPLSVMQSALEGTLNESALAAIEVLFPVHTAEMKVQVATVMQDPELSVKLSYQQRLSMDNFLGGGWEQANSPESLLIFGDRSAQTPAQEQAQRGPSAMRNTAPQATTNTDRLSAL